MPEKTKKKPLKMNQTIKRKKTKTKKKRDSSEPKPPTTSVVHHKEMKKWDYSSGDPMKACRAARHELKLSYTQIADETGAELGGIISLFTGKITPRLRATIQPVMKRLGIVFLYRRHECWQLIPLMEVVAEERPDVCSWEEVTRCTGLRRDQLNAIRKAKQDPQLSSVRALMKVMQISCVYDEPKEPVAEKPDDELPEASTTEEG